MAGIAWQVLKQLVFSFVFFWPGWLVVKMITLGRYPRSIHPGKADWLHHELLSFVGVAAVAGAIFLVAGPWQ
jgi:hypothetical protein